MPHVELLHDIGFSCRNLMRAQFEWTILCNEIRQNEDKCSRNYGRIRGILNYIREKNCI